MLGVGGDVFVGVPLEVDEGDVFEFSGVVVFAPFGVAVAVGSEAGAEDFSDSLFMFEILAEASGFPWGSGVF